MGAFVFMKAQPPITRRFVRVESDFIIHNGEHHLTDQNTSGNTLTADIPQRPTRAFEDEVLKKKIEEAARSLAV